ncbi:helix-turn-helix domain-containing protein [Aquabacterium fontiphilum]|uniref:AraC family transcriptional regulator n=1 Tax=Aquabacterium fontiphilum TaxID=450365 RepID=UPI001377B753|nr:helix-turn-helix domain-containing protein [Aquabacterium fontiphilum]
MTRPAPSAPTSAQAADWLAPALHPIYARLICAEMRRRGFDEAQILAGTRLNWAALHEGQRHLSLDEVSRLIRRAIHLTQAPWLGITVGWGTQLSAHGPVGVAAMSCDNVGQALALIQRHVGLRQSLIALTVQPDGQDVALVAQERLQAPDVREYILGHLMGAGLRLLDTLTGLDMTRLARVEFAFPEPPWGEAYRQWGPDVRFGAEHTALILPLRLLAHPGLAPDPQSHRMALRECERLWAQQNDPRDRLGPVGDRILKALLRCEGRYPRLDELAEREHVSPRTLIRKLREEGLTYQQLLDRVREDLACWWLLHSDSSVDAIADRLGYQDTSNFSRTFRRWVGMTPSDFRRSARAQPTFTP